MRKLILYNLKKKRNFALINLSIVILIVILFMIINKYYIEASVIAVISAAIISIIGTFIDFNMFVNENKLTYFASKPISIKKRVDSLLISNLIYMVVSVLIALLITRATAQIAVNLNENLVSVDYLRHFSTVYRGVYCIFLWCTSIILLIGLSSMYCGATSSQVVTTALNFIIPIMLYLSVYAIITIDLQNINITYNQMTQYYLDKIIPLMNIYYLDIFDEYTIWQLVRFLVTNALLYGLLQFAIRARKNERVGEFIVSYGYKSFIVIFATTFLASVSIFIFENDSYIAALVTFLLNFALIYYIIFTIVEKNFKIGMNKISLLIKYLIVSSIIIVASAFLIKMAYTSLPDAEEVSKVYVTSEWDSFDLVKNVDKSFDKNRLMEYEDDDTIRNFIAMNRLSNNYISNADTSNVIRNAAFSIIYELNDGSRMIRNIYTAVESSTIYEMTNSKQLIDKMNSIIYNIMKSDDFIEQKKEYMDELLSNNVEFSVFELDDAYQLQDNNVFETISNEDFKKAYFADIEAIISDVEYSKAIDFDYFSRKYILENSVMDKNYSNPVTYSPDESDPTSKYVCILFIDTPYEEENLVKDDVDRALSSSAYYGVKRDSLVIHTYNYNMLNLFKIEPVK